MEKYAGLFFGTLILSVLYLVSLYSYPLFHDLIEMLGVIIIFWVFMTTWSSRRIINNNYLLFVGISFLFVGAFDLLHIFAHSGMGVFKEHDGGDLSARLWISARYMQSASFLVAIFFIGRSLRVSLVLFVCAVIASVLLFAVFHRQAYPESVSSLNGLTDFAKLSVEGVSVIFAAAMVSLIHRRKDFDRRLLILLLAALAAAICTDAAFVFRRSIDGPVNLLGHFTNIGSFYFIYAAIVRTALENPYDVLFSELKRNESLLKKERQRARRYLDIVDVMLVMIDADGAVGFVNRKGCEYLGYDEKEIIGSNWFDMFLPERIREKSRDVFRKSISGEIEQAECHEDAVLTKEGKERIIAWRSNLIEDGGGGNIGRLSSGIDVTARKEAEEMLKASENRLKAITIALGEGIYVLDSEGRLVFMNREAENILGWKEQELKGRRVHPLVHAHKVTGNTQHHPEDCPITETVNSGKVYRIAEDIFIRKDGTPFPVTLTSTPVRDDDVITGSVVAFHDITARKRSEEALRRANELLARQATTDALTGTHNRLKFNGLLDMEIRKARRYDIPLSLIMFDIDSFKVINDEYGHQTGDSVLQELAGLVAQNIRDADLFTRWGGEEFMILVPENKLRSAFQLAEKLRTRIQTHQFRSVGKVTCSFGVTEFTEEDTPVSFTKRVDEAMYTAKENGKNRTECR